MNKLFAFLLLAFAVTSVACNMPFIGGSAESNTQCPVGMICATPTETLSHSQAVEATLTAVAPTPSPTSWTAQEVEAAVAATLTAMPTMTATHTPAATQSAGLPSNGQCLMENIGSFEEQTGGSAHMIEFGTGSHEQIIDYYPRADMGGPISVIAPALGQPYGINGYGSLHEVTVDSPPCDVALNAIDYAQVRLEYGHSGVTIDIRGNLSILTNKKNLNREAMSNMIHAYFDHLPFAGQIDQAINNWFQAHPEG